MTNATRTTGAYTVQRYAIIGTQTVAYAAYEPYNGHTSTMHIDNVRMGKVTSRPLPADLDALPARSSARLTAVLAHFDALRAESLAAIVAAFPEAAHGTPSSGEVYADAALVS